MRVYGDAALVEATTTYGLGDGQRRQGRYTDVYVRGDAGWRCVAAILTPVKE